MMFCRVKKKRQLLRSKAIVIQRKWRRYKASKKQRFAAVVIQTMYRGFLARKQMESLRREQIAAAKYVVVLFQLLR